MLSRSLTRQASDWIMLKKQLAQFDEEYKWSQVLDNVLFLCNLLFMYTVVLFYFVVTPAFIITQTTFSSLLIIDDCSLTLSILCGLKPLTFIVFCYICLKIFV